MESIVMLRKRKNYLTAPHLLGPTSSEYNTSSQDYRLLKQSTNLQDPKTIPQTSSLRVRWDVLIICLTLYNCYSVPYSLTFEANNYHVLLVCFDLIVDTLFIIDIYLNFRTSYIDRRGEEVFSRKRIAKNYISTGRLILDLLACVPVSLIDYLIGLYFYISVLKLLKITRIFRVSKIIQYMRLTQQIKLPLRICKMIVYSLFCVHLNACFWKVIISVDKRWFSPSFSIQDDPLMFYDLNQPNQYLFCMYYSISILLGVEILPHNTSTYVYCSVFIIFGALFFTYVFGEIAVLVMDIKKHINQFSIKMDFVAGIIYRLKLNDELRIEIIEYFKEKYTIIRKNGECISFSGMLPKSYMKKINEFLFKELIFSVRTLRLFPNKCKAIISKLKYSFLKPSDYLIRAGEESEEFFIIFEGEFEVWVEDLDSQDCFMRKLGRNDYCGEIGVLYNQRRTASVLSISHSTFGFISKKEFLGLISQSMEIELKRNVALYNDPYRKNITKLMKKLCYLERIDDLAINDLLYSMRIEHYDDNTIVFEDKAIASQVLFVLDGTLQLTSNVYDTDLQKRIFMRNCTGEHFFNKQRSLVTFKKGSPKRSSVRKTLRPERMANLSLCKLKGGSILCGIQALFYKKLNICCFTRTKTRILMLNIDNVFAVAKENIRLRMAISNIKKYYACFNSQDENAHNVPEFDCYKFIVEEIPNEKKHWKVSKRWKNAILMVIMRNRRQFRIKPAIVRKFYQRIRSLEAKVRKNWAVLAAKVAPSQISYDYLKFAQLLSATEITEPLFRDFALSAIDLHKSQGKMENCFDKLLRKLNKMNRRRERLRIKTKEIEDIIRLLHGYF